MTLLLHPAHIAFLRCFLTPITQTYLAFRGFSRLVQENGSLHCDRLRFECKFKRMRSLYLSIVLVPSVEQTETAKRVQARSVSLHRVITDFSLLDAGDPSPEYPRPS